MTKKSFSKTGPRPLTPDPLLSGHRLDRDAANRLWDADLLALGAAADGVRRKLNPEPRVTYVIDRNINYTNVCVSGCRFCAFYRPPGAEGGYVLGWDELAAKLQELKDHGGSGVLLQGGLNPELGPDYYKSSSAASAPAAWRCTAFHRRRWFSGPTSGA